MKAKYTAGPWTTGRSILDRWRIEEDNCDGKAIATGIANEANARLIAAAPDLLEALMAALERIPNEHDFDHTPSDDAVRDQARAAVAKATGGEA
jgi:hypothetical protein